MYTLRVSGSDGTERNYLLGSYYEFIDRRKARARFTDIAKRCDKCPLEDKSIYGAIIGEELGGEKNNYWLIDTCILKYQIVMPGNIVLCEITNEKKEE